MATTVRLTYRHEFAHNLVVGRPTRSTTNLHDERRQLVALCEANDFTAVHKAAQFGLSEVTVRRTYRRETHPDRKPSGMHRPAQPGPAHPPVELGDAKDPSVAAIAAQFGVSKSKTRRTYRLKPVAAVKRTPQGGATLTEPRSTQPACRTMGCPETTRYPNSRTSLGCQNRYYAPSAAEEPNPTASALPAKVHRVKDLNARH